MRNLQLQGVAGYPNKPHHFPGSMGFVLDLRWPWTSICKSSSQPLLMHRLQWTVGNCIGALCWRVGQLGMCGIQTIFTQTFASRELQEGMPYYAYFPAGSKDRGGFWCMCLFIWNWQCKSSLLLGHLHKFDALCHAMQHSAAIAGIIWRKVKERWWAYICLILETRSCCWKSWPNSLWKAFDSKVSDVISLEGWRSKIDSPTFWVLCSLCRLRGERKLQAYHIFRWVGVPSGLADFWWLGPGWNGQMHLQKPLQEGFI